ncbi:aminoacyl-tRNA hydrolase [Candidatus Daviesbacteria bacterium]|nr:aminoacyl-tRNA hydrolase [Candidatus Daviesbacteria bacterium]
MKLVVGLGNPEDKYIYTRHNLGFDFLDAYKKKKDLGEWSTDNKFKSEIIKLNQDLILARPLTFMNNSGIAVSSLANFFKVPAENVIVVHDDLDLLLGKIKVRFGGGAGGHHGVESVIGKLGTDKFIRLRFGIGNEKAFAGEHKRISFEAEKFVLENFLQKEHQTVKAMFKKGIEALDLVLEKGPEKAQCQYN